MRNNWPNPDLPDQPSELDCLESIGAILGYFHQKYGPKTLNELLAMNDLDRETLEGEAARIVEVEKPNLTADQAKTIRRPQAPIRRQVRIGSLEFIHSWELTPMCYPHSYLGRASRRAIVALCANHTALKSTIEI